MNIIERIKELTRYEVLAIYYGGSRAYGLEDDKSDTDYMVIIDGPVKFKKINFDDENAECFVMGKEEFKRVQNLEEETFYPVTAHADNILGILLWNNLVYLNPKYELEFIELVNADWNKKLARFLRVFVDFYRCTICECENYKRHYHVYRMKYLIKHHQESGVFSLKLTEEERKGIEFYKAHYKALPSNANEIVRILDEIEDYIKVLEVEK